MKKVIIIAILIVICAFLVSIFTMDNESVPELSYKTDFNEPLDTEFWLISPWNMYKQMPEVAPVRDGFLKLANTTSGNIPYLLTKPIPLKMGDVVTLKRKVKIKRGGEVFSGGIAMYQTDDKDLIPEKSDGDWATSFGDGVFLLEYSYDLKYEQERPGRDVFRFLAADWSYNENYSLIPPVYDEWVEEIITFDTRSSQMTYTVNGKSYKLNSFKLDRENVRFMFHAYGLGEGNSVEMDWLEIQVEDKRVKKKS